jgi:hypothetical protein
VDTLPVEELFEMTRELAIYIRASQAESAIWDLVPQACHSSHLRLSWPVVHTLMRVGTLVHTLSRWLGRISRRTTIG